MPQTIFFCPQIIDVMLARLCLNRYLLDYFYAIDFQAIYLLGVIGQYSDIFQAEVAAYLCADAVIAFVRHKAEFEYSHQRYQAPAPAAYTPAALRQARSPCLPAADK